MFKGEGTATGKQTAEPFTRIQECHWHTSQHILYANNSLGWWL